MALPLLGILGAGLAAQGLVQGFGKPWAAGMQERARGERASSLLDGLAPDAGPDQQANALFRGGMLDANQYMAGGFRDHSSERDFLEDLGLANRRHENALQLQQRAQEFQQQSAMTGKINDVNQYAIEHSYGLGLPAGSPELAQVLHHSKAGISGIESGGRLEPYLAVNPESGALGKYQVMPANVPQWTERHLGVRMTPDQFLASADAQEKVFEGQFGEYVRQYGASNAASMWFSGRPLAQSYADSDGNMVGLDYNQRFIAGYNNSLNSAMNKQEAQQATNTAVLGARDASDPFTRTATSAGNIVQTLQQLPTGAIVAKGVGYGPEAQAAYDDMRKQGEELYHDWRKQVYGDAEPSDAVQRDFREIFRNPAGKVASKERTIAFFQMMAAEAQKMGQYKQTRAMVEAGQMPAAALNGLNNGYLTTDERNQITGQIPAQDPATVPGGIADDQSMLPGPVRTQPARGNSQAPDLNFGGTTGSGGRRASR